MVMLTGTFSKLRKFVALVIGDFMLDIYTTGAIHRISPEAPVSVLHVGEKKMQAGGAGNVAIGLQSLGAEVLVMGRIGIDESGILVKQCLEKKGIETAGLLEESGYVTPIKNRLIADRQQILRVDEEQTEPLASTLEEQVLSYLNKVISSISIIAISDYNKGFLTKQLLQKIIAKAKKHKVPVICDPKGTDFSKYSGAYLIKPNLKEAFIAAGVDSSKDLQTTADKILENTNIGYLLITKSEKGMSLFQKDRLEQTFPVASREVMDVTGAGDTVLATLCAGIASDLDVAQCIQLANAAAGIAIQRLGCASITLNDLARRLLEMDSDNKIFDEMHLYALKKALENRVFSVLVIDTTFGITPGLFQTIRNITKKDQHELLLYVRNDNPNEDLVHILSSLKEVSFVILRKESLQRLCDATSPQQVHVLQEEKESASWLQTLSINV